MKNKLYFGDNLNIMREYVPDESIDLIYLDPPFNSKATYNVLFAEKNGTQSKAQITAFEDSWHWCQESEETYYEIITHSTKKLADMMQAMRSFLGTNDMMAYLTMMAVRLVEMHRVLKSTGSIYLHCDPTASHYLKLVIDAIFGVNNFRNEIVWCYRRYTASSNRFQKIHDIILFYSKTDNAIFNDIRIPYSDKSGTKDSHYKQDTNGRWFRWQKRKGQEPYKIYLSEGVRLGDWWELQHINASAKERLGYPTQKPEALLERIIKASSNEGDMILDPFCGCGTSIAVAEHLNRKWIGIDITHLAITLMKHRLEDTFGPELSAYEVVGDPKDLHGAKALAEHDRYQFEWWALGKVAARPAQNKQKGADSGVDGYLYFIDDNSGKARTIIVQVKSGNVARAHIATLKGDMEREKAVIGAFITLQEPTRPMKKEAAGAGFYKPEHFPEKRCPRLQILTIEELLNGKQLQYPRVAPEVTFKKAERKRKRKEDQLELL